MRVLPRMSAAWLGLVGCVSTTPRFDPDIQRAINGDDMRRMETRELVVYYPDGTRAETLEVARRLEYCRHEIQRRALLKQGPAAEKSVFVLPRLPLNNAYVRPTLAGNEQIAVVPQYNTSNLFIAYGIPPDPGIIGCHEMVHDQSFRQISGFAATLRAIFGDAYSPQAGLDPWWQEGLAVYYETKLQGTGRLWTKYFGGLFAAGIQDVSTLHGGYLSFLNREVSAGAEYLVGAHFIDYLARTYGERRLWQVILEQSNAWGFPFAISNEFRLVYDKQLSELIGEFEADTRRRYPRRERPAQQRTLARLGNVAGYARAANGVEVFVSEDVDDPPRIIARSADGTILSSRRLTDIGIGRRLIAPRVGGISGLSLTGDGAHAYFVALDAGPLFSQARLMHLDLVSDQLAVVLEDIAGAGGSISPDGARYYFNRPVGDAARPSHAVFRLELESGEVARLTTPSPRHYQLDPVVSPDGQRLLVTEASDAGIRLAIYSAVDGRRLADVPAPEGPAFDGSWVDEQHVLFAGTDPARMQLFEADLRSRVFRPVSDAPYLAVSGFADGRTLRFLNREGWNWTLDEVPYRTPAASLANALPGPAPLALAPPASAGLTPVLPAAPPRHRAIAERAPVVLSDDEYSGFDGLFRPSAWAPWLALYEEDQVAVGLSATGGDRLGWQRWALGAAWNVDAKLPSGRVSYLNAMLAPLSLRADAAYIGRREQVLDDFRDAPVEPVRIREIVGSMRASASAYDSYRVEFGARYSHARYELESSGARLRELGFAGPLASFGFDSAETTPYSGKRLAVGLDATGTFFPDSFSTVDYDLLDALGRSELVLPVPLSRRHTLTLAGRARALLGAPPGQNLLQIGGSASDVLPLLRDGSPTDDGGAGLLPPGLRFFEALRGFEDLPLFGRRALIGDATYTYPFIIDWGSASTLRLFPALFVREVDLDLFFSTASRLDPGLELALATGASLELKFALWLVPISLELQGARRLSHDEDYALYFAVGSDSE
jgi:hypothetical protein